MLKDGASRPTERNASRAASLFRLRAAAAGELPGSPTPPRAWAASSVGRSPTAMIPSGRCVTERGLDVKRPTPPARESGPAIAPIPPGILEVIAAITRQHQPHAECRGGVAKRANLISGRRRDQEDGHKWNSAGSAQQYHGSLMYAAGRHAETSSGGASIPARA